MLSLHDDGVLVGGSLLLLFVITLGGAGGVGAGSLVLPILLLVFQFSSDRGVVLSITAVVGSSLWQVARSLKSIHPSDSSRSLIFWPAVLIFFPLEVIGSLIGHILLRVMPSIFQILLGIIVLIFTVYKTYIKGCELRSKELSLMMINTMNETDGYYPQNSFQFHMIFHIILKYS